MRKQKLKTARRSSSKSASTWAIAWLLILAVTGCSQMLGNLRRDLDDSEPYVGYGNPTVGGRWSERGLLADEPRVGNDPVASNSYNSYDDPAYSRVGHSERNPASSSIAMQGESEMGNSGFGSDGETAQNQMSAPTYASTPNLPPQTQRLYKNGARATKNDFLDESPNEGSLWASDGQTNYYFTKNKIRGIGDIITITMEEDLYRDAVTELTRTLSPKEREYELSVVQEKLAAQAYASAGLNPDGTALGSASPTAAKDQLATGAAAPSRSPASGPVPEATKDTSKEAAAAEAAAANIKVRKATLADIDIAPVLQMKAGDTLMTEIMERYPNGNYKVRGTKRIPYRGGYRMLTMVAIAKSADIGEDDTIASGKLYEYRLETLR